MLYEINVCYSMLIMLKLWGIIIFWVRNTFIDRLFCYINECYSYVGLIYMFCYGLLLLFILYDGMNKYVMQ